MQIYVKMDAICRGKIHSALVSKLKMEKCSEKKEVICGNLPLPNFIYCVYHTFKCLP